jgi:membrane associated rhomboid family serine protease/tetratricopeptide (TPR) repeat protein
MDLETSQPAPIPRVPQPDAAVSQPSRSPRLVPVATIVIISLCVLAFVLQTLAGGSKNTDVLIDFGASYKPYFEQGQYWRAVMPLFLHIGLWHLAVNMYALLMIGPVLERMYGYGRYAVIYLGAGIAGCLLSMYRGHALAAGASGAIFGVAGAIVVAGWVHREAMPHELERIFRRGRFTLVLLIFIAIQLAAGHMVSNIDNWGHLGGLLGGAVLALLIPPSPWADVYLESVYRRQTGLPPSTTGWQGIEPQAAANPELVTLQALAGPSHAFQSIVLLPAAIVVLSMAAAAEHYRISSRITRLLADGQRLELAHQPGQAFDRYQRAQELDSHDERAAIALGQLEMQQHDAGRAIAEFQKALKIDPDSLPAAFGLAAAYQANGNTAEAERAFQALATENPDVPDAQEAVADLLAEQKLYARAVERYQAVLRLSPNSAVAHNNLAWLYATADDPKYRDPAAALAHARKAVALSKWQVPNFIDTLAESLYVNRQYAEAVNVQAKALAIEPNNREFQEHMARYKAAAGP